ncbi:MAG: tetratricopeptide (TPR) repeat protein [Paraglaciecola sp.]
MNYLQIGFAAHKRGEILEAEKYYLLHLKNVENDYNALQLLGMLSYKVADYQKAIDYMLLSLQHNAKQPNTENNIGNAFKRISDYKNARLHYEKAIQLEKKYQNAWNNLISLLVEVEEYVEALLLAKKANTLFGHSKRLLLLCAQANRGLLQYEEAIGLLQSILHSQSDDVSAKLELGKTYYCKGQYETAIKYYFELINEGINEFAIWHNLGNAYSNLSRFDEAIDAYQNSINLNPSYAQSYKNITELRWEIGDHQGLFTHYKKAFESSLGDVNLQLDYLEQVIRLGLNKEALTIVEVLNNANSMNTRFIGLSSRAFKVNGDIKKAYEIEKTILNFKDVTNQSRLSFVETALQNSQFVIAQQELAKVLKLEPDNQFALALNHTGARLAPLIFDNNILLADKFIFEFTINPPAEFNSIIDYCQALDKYLQVLHKGKHQPLDQTLHLGVQTRGNLFDDNHPLITHLVNEFERCIEDAKTRIQEISKIENICLYQGFNSSEPSYFSGSWSVRLHNMGYHSNHMHPMGWLSSAFYVTLPEEIQSESKKAGWFQVGVPNIDLQSELKPTRYIKPEVGKLILFPSFLWHGTVPFEEESYRLTVAYDVRK